MPVMEKQSGGVELCQSPNRKNNHERQKGGKFGAFVVGPQYDFVILIATSTVVGIWRQRRQCAGSWIGIRDRTRAAVINKK